MFDISSEEPLTLSQAASLLPKRRNGKRPHLSTLFRWASTGLRGVKLEVVKVGGTLCTSRPALQRFFDSLTKQDERLSGAIAPSPKPQDDQTESRLDELGI